MAEREFGPLEEAEYYHSLMDKEYLSSAEVAQRVGKERRHILDMLRLLNLPLGVRDYLRSGALELGHARLLLVLKHDQLRLEWGRRCVEGKMSVEKLKRLLLSDSN